MYFSDNIRRRRQMFDKTCSLYKKNYIFIENLFINYGSL